MKMFININKELNEQGKALAQKLADALPKASGELARSISYKVDEEGNLLSVELEAAEYYKYVDEGRSAGRFPPISEIQAWTRQRNIPIEASFAIAKKIAEEGTEGAHVTEEVQPSESEMGAKLAEPAAMDLEIMYQKMLDEIFK